MKNISRYMLVCSLMIFFAINNSSCQDKTGSIIIISADSLKAILKDPNGKLLDVRTPEEFSSGHIESAVNIDYNDEGFDAALDTLDKNIQYVLYCRSGRRSAEAAEMMEKKGFQKIIHLENGILEWKEKGFLIVK